jgi:hypothetical protein
MSSYARGVVRLQDCSAIRDCLVEDDTGSTWHELASDLGAVQTPSPGHIASEGEHRMAICEVTASR